MKIDLTRNAVIRVGLITAVLLNVVLTAGIAIAYHEGYQSGIERGVEIGSDIATEDDSTGDVVSNDPGTTSPEDTNGQTPEDDPRPQAGVTFDQRDGENGVDVRVQVVSMENADSVFVAGRDRKTCENCMLTRVGETATVRGLAPGDKVVVVAVLEGKEAVIQTYSVADPYHT